MTDGVFEDLWPEQPALSAGIKAFRDKVLNRWRLTRIPEMLTAAGLSEIGVETDIDRVYGLIGGAGPAQLENIAESYVEVVRAQHHLVGGEAEANQLARDLLAFVSDPASAAFSTHWTFTATKP